MSVHVQTRPLFCFGHRGARGHAPENTVRSVRAALELGAHGIEVDVYGVEGRLVVIHDATLRRTTNGRGQVRRQTLAHLRSLDAGQGERIPILEEIFDAVNHRAWINVELKGPQTAALVVALIERYVTGRGWRLDEFLVSSFDHAQLARARELNANLPLGILFERQPARPFALAESLQACSIHLPLKSVTAPFVRAAHLRGLQVFVYTVNRPADIARMSALGVDGVFSDYPERVVRRAPAKP
jgi:glycerophosphoryl diester phosphodiesterase